MCDTDLTVFDWERPGADAMPLLRFLIMFDSLNILA